MLDLSPLFELRLWTPRLELRVPTDRELIDLRDLAHAGIHPPEVMPFAIPWTDEPYSEDFVVAYYRRQRAVWQPQAWNLHLGIWAEGRLAGVQGMRANQFAQTREVETGSWLGQSFQGQGYGTEMRAAVLELAFRGLAARRALSGALDGNTASHRVSEKLGYRVVGRNRVAPRGAPVGHTIREITGPEWRSP